MRVYWKIPAYEYSIAHSTCKVAAFFPTILPQMVLIFVYASRIRVCLSGLAGAVR